MYHERTIRSLLSESDSLHGSVITDGLLFTVGQYHGKLALLQHARIVALTVAEGQRTGLVIPAKRDDTVRSFLVIRKA